MHFGERVVEAHVMVGLVFQRQTVRPGDAAVTVEHGFIGVDCDGGMNGVGMVDGHLDGGHEVRQLAPAVDDAGDADCRGLGEQLLHVVHRYFRLSFSTASWLMARANGMTDATCVWLSMTCASSGSGDGAGAQLRSR